MKIVFKQKLNIWRSKQKILVYNKHTINPFLEAKLISFSYIPRNSKKLISSYTHNSPHQIGFQALKSKAIQKGCL